MLGGLRMRKFTNIDDRLDFIEFRQDLLFYRDATSEVLFENNITRNEYSKIMDLMDKYREMIDKRIKVNNSQFEEEMYAILPLELNGNYHFCENITRAFMEDRRWEEVFWELYGDLPKYAYLRR